MNETRRLGDPKLREKLKAAQPPSAARHALTRLNEIVSRVGEPFGWRLTVDLTYEGSYLWGFERTETRYDRQTGQAHASALRSLIPPNARVLDIGCGYGRIERFLSPHCSEIHGVDASGTAVRRATRYVPESNCYFRRISGTDLSRYPDGWFDFAFSVGTLQHVSRETAFGLLAETYRVLRSGGKALVHFPDLRKSVAQFALSALLGVDGSTRMRYYTDEEARALFEFLGFREIDILPDGFLHENALHVLGRK
jgi:SAM-dependent methyltransferase